MRCATLFRKVNPVLRVREGGETLRRRLDEPEALAKSGHRLLTERDGRLALDRA